LLAIAANQFGVDLFYGVRLYLGSAAVVLALLLLGRWGLLVGAASVVLVPRLWSEPQAAIVLMAELVWLALYLRQGEGDVERRERGDVVFADVLFWIVIAIPLLFLLSGVLANVDLPKVLDLSLLQAVNGSLNAVLAYALFLLLRIVQAGRVSEAPGVSLQGLTLISLLGLALASSLFTLTVSMRQLDREVIDDQLIRFRQLAQTSAALQRDALDDLTALRRQQDSPVDFRVLDGGGRILYDSNPALFATLDDRYEERNTPLSQQPEVSEPLDLLIPRDCQVAMTSGLRGYWRYETKDDHAAHDPGPSPSARDLRVVIVEPARSGIRELQVQSSRAIRQLALLVLLATATARSLSRWVTRQFPETPAPQGFRAEDDRSAAMASPRRSTSSHSGQEPRSLFRELQPLVQALRLREEILVNLRESFRRSERQRHRLEAEVGKLNILDPLTGCFNRRELYRRLEHELRMNDRERRPLGFLAVEIDHLRQIHDSYGQEVYEEVLRRVAMELRSRSRVTDLLCRFGSEQLGLLLPGCDPASAARVAELLSVAVRNLEIRHQGTILAVTLSVGVASLRSGRDDPDSLITRAQSALYRAKAEGRDRIVIA